MAPGGDPPVVVAVAPGGVVAVAPGGDPRVAVVAPGGDPRVAVVAPGGDPPADAAPAPVTVWGTPVVAGGPVFRVTLTVRGPSAAGDPRVVEGTHNVGLSSKEKSETMTSEQCDIMLEMMEEDLSDDDLLKRSQKRKNTNSEKKMNKTKKTSVYTESESDFPMTQEASQCVYSPEKIKTFLEQTKGSRLPKVGDFFPDLQLFIRSARPLTRKSGGEEVLTEQEIYRLKKLVLRVKAQIIDDEDDF